MSAAGVDVSQRFASRRNPGRCIDNLTAARAAAAPAIVDQFSSPIELYFAAPFERLSEFCAPALYPRLQARNRKPQPARGFGLAQPLTIDQVDGFAVRLGQTLDSGRQPRGKTLRVARVDMLKGRCINNFNSSGFV